MPRRDLLPDSLRLFTEVGSEVTGRGNRSGKSEVRSGKNSERQAIKKPQMRLFGHGYYYCCYPLGFQARCYFYYEPLLPNTVLFLLCCVL